MRSHTKYKFYLKKVGDLSKDEKEQMMQLMIATYPAFKRYYLKNKYYSTVRPQMTNLIKDGDSIAGVGKFLWRNVTVGERTIKFLAFGVLIAKEHQKIGLGGSLIAKNIKEAKKMGADILYGTTSNPAAENIMRGLGFKKLDTPVYYKDVEKWKVRRERNRVWIFEFKKGIIEEIEKSPKFYIGTGPL